MAVVTKESGAATERTEEAEVAAAGSGSGGAATEHAEEPQLAELIKQEASLSNGIDNQKKDKNEFKEIADRWQSETPWKFKAQFPWSALIPLEAQGRGVTHGHQQAISVPRTRAARLLGVGAMPAAICD